MTDYAKMAREYQEELLVLEQRLTRAKAKHRPCWNSDDDREVNMLESMCMELRVTIRELSRRAEEQGKEEKP